MEPKTKLHKHIVALSMELTPITEKQKQWAVQNCFDKYAARSRNTLFCLECGSKWKNELGDIKLIEVCQCPDCGKVLKLKQSPGPVWEDMVYCAVITVKGGFQVVRMLCLKKHMYKNQAATVLVDEVMQHWMDENAKVVTLEKQVRGFSYYVDLWIHSTSLEVRTLSARSEVRHGVDPVAVYPRKNVLPIIKRNGFKNSVYEMSPLILFKMLLTDSTAETLIKSGQYSLLKYYSIKSNSIKSYWYAIKICMRNNYIVKDASIWFDYLQLLTHFGKDLRNPVFLCPPNLKKAHNYYMNKKQVIETMETTAEFEKNRRHFFGLQFSNGAIVVKVIESINEFKQEAEALSHCVYKNEYFKKKDALILSARIENKPVETIHISLAKMKIIQARGWDNKPTPYHSDIIALVNKNMKLIKRASKMAS